MNLADPTTLADTANAMTVLRDLCKPFAAGRELDLRCTVVQPDQIPYPADQLLVHHEHMTVVLEKHHGRPVNVHVMEERLDGDLYSRKIYLTPDGRDDLVVEWGIVRLDFKYVSDEVRAEILSKQSPLGAVLIRHDVLRRIKPRWFLRFPPDGPVLDLFDGGHREPAYGRIGTIYCNEEPAIELLEIAVNTGASALARAYASAVESGNGNGKPK